MEIRNVATFVKIVEFNNFTRAAEHLGYSQAAVTVQIKALEKELGLPLFDRMGKRIALTQAGRTFLPYALKLLQAEEEARYSVRPREELAGELRICTSSSYAESVLPQILLRYNSLHPSVTIIAKISDYPEDTKQKLARGEIDFLLCLDEDKLDPAFLTVVSTPAPMLFLTWPDNPLRNMPSLTLRDIVADQFIVCDREIGYSSLLERYLQKCGIEFHPVMELGSPEAVLRILLKGYGVSFVPKFAAARYLESGQLVAIDCPEVRIPLFASFLCSKERWINPVMQEFIRIVQEEGATDRTDKA